MRNFVTIIILSLIGNSMILPSAIGNSDECQKSSVQSAMSRLEKYLFCNYNPEIPPNAGTKKPMQIWIWLGPKTAYFDEMSNTLDFHADLYMVWSDPRLQWDLFSFNGIYSFSAPPHKLWIPEFAGESTQYTEDRKNSLASACDVYLPYFGPIGGDVICHIGNNRHYKIACQSDFTNWPYDRQNCTLIMEFGLHNNNELTFRQWRLLDTKFLFTNGEWNISAAPTKFFMDKKSIFGNKISPTVTVDFILDRASNHHSAAFVSPAIIMMVMTLTTVWLDPRSIERLSIASSNIVVHLLCIQSLHWTLPHTGLTIPNILIFYIYSLVFATMALLLTFIMSSIQTAKSSPPKWMSLLTRGILRSNVGQILLFIMLDPTAAAVIEADANDTGDLINTKAEQPTWGYTVILCGWITFLTYFCAYVAMTALLMPHPLYKN